jgi:aminopeptidase N
MLSFLVAAALAAVPAAPEPGVSETLARARFSAIRDLRYDVALRISGNRSRPVDGRVIVTFTLRAPTDVVLDFAQPAERVRAVRVADRDVPFTVRNGHIVIAADATRAGENAITVDFVAGDESLNRGEDFLYTLFVPSRAQLAFPCFDQPDLKARTR